MPNETPIDISQLPEPPVPATLDLREIQRMQLDIVALLSSETYALATGMQFKAALTLWIRAFHQVPAGSLPNNPLIIASLAGYGGSAEQFELFERQIKPVALRNFTLCRDGRLYHKKVCEIALKTARWLAKQKGATNDKQGGHNAETPGLAQFRNRLSALGRASGRR